jgi:hypothetical protein
MTREEIKVELEQCWNTVFDSLLFEEFYQLVQNRCDLPLTEYNEFELAGDFQFVLDLMKDDSMRGKYDIF